MEDRAKPGTHNGLRSRAYGLAHSPPWRCEVQDTCDFEQSPHRSAATHSVDMGFLADIAAIVRTYWAALLIVLIAVRLVRNRYKPVLRDIPGPFLASLSDLWLLQHCIRGKSYKDYELHRKYDTPLLRLGPNTISVADIEASRIIYGWKPVFKKVKTIPRTPRQ